KLPTSQSKTKNSTSTTSQVKKSQNETSSTSSSASKKADNEKLYASVLDMYRPIIVNKSVSSVPSSLATDEAYATNIIFDAVNAGETIQYSFADINKDGKDELLIGSPERVHAIYYLNNTDQPVFAISAGTYAKGGYLSDMKIYSDGTIYCQQFQRMRPEAKAETYEIKNGAFNQTQSVDFSMADTKDGTSLVGLNGASLFELGQESWKDFSVSNDSQTSTNEAKNDSSSKESSSSKSDAKQSGMDINAIQRGDFSSVTGTWKNGRGDTLTFDNNGLVSDKERVTTEYAKITDGYLIAGTGPKSGVGPGGGAMAFLPTGVFLTNAVTSSNDNVDDQSDKNKDRIWAGQSLIGTTDDSYFYYKVN
ncbi:MAG: DUF6287 domain-containing protein, partial [Streptococcus vestibularis]|nr:DUF6287 domain-containing protein [Streptococcus vestibularis]